MDQIMGAHWQGVDEERQWLKGQGWSPVHVADEQTVFFAWKLRAVPVHCNGYRLQVTENGEVQWVSTNPLDEVA